MLSLLRMRRIGDATWRTTCVDLNSLDAVFGGQLLAQALPDKPHLHAAAFAYLSDQGFNLETAAAPRNMQMALC